MVFPKRYVDKNSEGRQWFPYIFQVKSPPGGVTLEMAIQLEQDLYDLMLARALFYSPLIMKSSNSGQPLTLSNIKAAVSELVARNIKDDAEWVRGSTSISIIHSPDIAEQLVSIFAKLPFHWQWDLRHMSICLDGEVYPFAIQTYENRFAPDGGMALGLIHPDDPAGEMLVGKDSGIFVVDASFDEKVVVERAAMSAFYEALVDDIGIDIGDLSLPRYEPLGNQTFPDFDFHVRGEEWAVEVTRIESGMVSHYTLFGRLDRKMIEKVAQTEVTEPKINNALIREVARKTKRLEECDEYARACLLLVDIVDAIEPNDSNMWSGVDLSAYEVVVLVRRDGSAVFIKGAERFEEPKESR